MIKRLGLIFMFGILAFSYGAVIPLNADISMPNGAYGVTNYFKKKPPKPLKFIYIGQSVSQVGKKKIPYRVYISEGKGKFGNGVYRVWLSFVKEDAFKSILQGIKKANEEAYKTFHKKPSVSAEEAADAIAPMQGAMSLTEVDCKKSTIDIVSGSGQIQMKMVYKIDKNSPALNKKIYNLVCTKGKLPIIYVK
jgi:hypothetical protein